MAFATALSSSWGLIPSGVPPVFGVALLAGIFVGLLVRDMTAGLVSAFFAGVAALLVVPPPNPPLDPFVLILIAGPLTLGACWATANLVPDPLRLRVGRKGPKRRSHKSPAKKDAVSGQPVSVRRWVILGVLAVLMINFLVMAGRFGQENVKAASSEPPAEGYAFDPVLIIKTFYLMKNGEDYYPAFRRAFVEDSRFNDEQAPNTLPQYRQPTLYLLWAWLLPKGEYIVYLFWFLSTLAMAASWLLVRRFADEIFGLIGAAFTGSYLLPGATSLWFAQAEYWGAFPALFSVTALAYEQEALAAFFAFLAAAIREWFALALLGGLVIAVVRRRWRPVVYWAVAFGAWVVEYFAHYLNAKPYLTHSVGSSAAAWLNKMNLSYLNGTVQFGASTLPLAPVLGWLAIACAAAGALLTIKDKMATGYYIAAAVMLPTMAFLFAAGPMNDYWGPIIMTTAFAACPLLLGWLWALARKHDRV